MNWKDEKEKLTEKEKNMFKHGLPGDRKIITGLKIAFGIGWSAWLAFSIWVIVDQILSGKTVNPLDISMLLAWVAVGGVFLFCVALINKRNGRIYDALKKDEYELIVTDSFHKDCRYQYTGKYHMMIEFYVCPQFSGQVTPISKK